MNENMNPAGNGYGPDQYTPQEERYIPSRYKNGGKSPVKGILLGFLIMLAFLGIQVVVMIPIMAGEMISTASDMVKNSGGDISTEEMEKALMGNVDAIGISIIATFVSMVVAIIWYRLVYCKGYKISDLKKSLKKVFTLRSFFGIVLAAISMYYLTNFLLVLIQAISPETMEEYNKLMESTGLITIDWKIIVMTVIMAPINEECIMRGMIFTTLKKNMAPIWAVLISALYFGIFHLNIVQGIYAAFLGLAMGYFAYKYETIIASMLFHAVFNGMNYILMALPESFMENTVLLFVIPVVTGVAWYFLEGKIKVRENTNFS